MGVSLVPSPDWERREEKGHETRLMSYLQSSARPLASGSSVSLFFRHWTRGMFEYLNHLSRRTENVNKQNKTGTEKLANNRLSNQCLFTKYAFWQKVFRSQIITSSLALFSRMALLELRAPDKIRGSSGARTRQASGTLSVWHASSPN